MLGCLVRLVDIVSEDRLHYPIGNRGETLFYDIKDMIIPSSLSMGIIAQVVS
jgi:hypothetical protein